MKSRVKWLDNMSFVGESASGHSIVMDGPPEAGGRDLGIRPMEMLLLGLGGCSSFDVVSMLTKGRQDISNCEVEISAKRADSIPKVFTEIHLHFIIEGKHLNETKVARAINLSAEKYCSASIMLAETATITHDYAIIQTSG
ncbi:MAG TPA: OsmC family protein [Leucothrix mucor]|uniref:OsmC family protein n=1 Tax=Leucothrix mucor TaxID=45248 RepID=A0A7V2WW19_LEUMU|nr:OsmC family protein [Leucothrix mucor]